MDIETTAEPVAGSIETDVSDADLAAFRAEMEATAKTAVGFRDQIKFGHSEPRVSAILDAMQPVSEGAIVVDMAAVAVNVIANILGSIPDGEWLPMCLAITSLARDFTGAASEPEEAASGG